MSESPVFKFMHLTPRLLSKTLTLAIFILLLVVSSAN